MIKRNSSYYNKVKGLVDDIDGSIVSVILKDKADSIDLDDAINDVLKFIKEADGSVEIVVSAKAIKE